MVRLNKSLLISRKRRVSKRKSSTRRKVSKKYRKSCKSLKRYDGIIFTKKSKKKTDGSSCVKSSLKKYTHRPGPPYPAQNCPGAFRRGNDLKLYRSVKDKNGIYKWKKQVRKDD